ncbi:MAG: type II toxin-antitoxin system RelE/ParE family toxin [Litoreibacter sp.]|uniref:type II toxin-antitoxin system RelE/ParE family toxin n=1 Tax=Litoreibacter sp. TaxID=1969459 RepID=UPI003297A6C3
MTYRLSKQAESDLIQIYLTGVEQFGVAQAETYQDKIDEMIALIGDNPEIARIREEISPPVRIHPVKSHVIIYLVDDHRMVRILRVRHGRENWPVNPIA